MERKPSLRESIRKEREEINLTDFRLTTSRSLSPEQPLPLVIEPALAGVNLAMWAANNRAYIGKELARQGAILFRNFAVDSPVRFQAVAQAISADGSLFDDYGDLPRELLVSVPSSGSRKDISSHRLPAGEVYTPNPNESSGNALGAKVYSSTPYPADKAILFHNEGSHTHRFPMKIFFYCVKAAEKQGATPLLDCRKTYQTIDPAIISRMTEKKLLYVRNFINGLDVGWQQFFQTTEKRRVEDYCRKASIAFEWKEGDQLTTRQVRPAVARHPHTGEMLFFNQLQLHHISCLDPDVRTSLLSLFREEDLPRNVYYGDGTRIEDDVVTVISAIYEQQAVRFQWQVGDVLVLDNMLVAHARDPFEGTRKILVAMAEVVSLTETSKGSTEQ